MQKTGKLHGSYLRHCKTFFVEESKLSFESEQSVKFLHWHCSCGAPSLKQAQYFIKPVTVNHE